MVQGPLLIASRKGRIYQNVSLSHGQSRQRIILQLHKNVVRNLRRIETISVASSTTNWYQLQKSYIRRGEAHSHTEVSSQKITFDNVLFNQTMKVQYEHQMETLQLVNI